MRSAVATLAVLVLVAACGPQGQDSDVSADELRSSVVTASKEVEQLLDEDGLRVRQSTGQYRACSTEPEPTIGYASSLTVPVSGEVAETVASTAEALEADGWELTSSGDTPRPYATAERSS